MLPEWFCVIGLIPISLLVYWLFYMSDQVKKTTTRKPRVKDEPKKEG